jgi:hypothetical protein
MTEVDFPGKQRAMNAREPARNASVLLGFRAENTRSFRDEFELSMLATRLADEDAVRYVTWREDGRPVGAAGRAKSRVGDHGKSLRTA